ncbi:sigma-54-dependent transcriptional regulator [Geomobilimonas luticola]|uniref:DNA-binding transcriptional regulator NtrC n=1 Tax=Geomobilimonas luticola TaxID=1114878 RepID=A0ABS5SGV5_9BACT|nr:sigma-54 dependent transcriptional regulator [Geomobilimonas luticola]MBT0654591.1 sigma-54 dependent transcriptional regulator [Geomobilimonas luticola]
MGKKLLILDDDPAILGLLQHFFEDHDIELLLETDSDSALKRIAENHPHVALIDISLPKMSGLEVLQEIKKIDPRVSVIIMTGHATTQNAIEAMKHGAFDYLTKPLDFNKLETVVDKAVENNLLNRGIRFVGEGGVAPQDESDADVMIGSSPEMTEIWKMVGKIADSNASVLIQGESGTGKELMARLIYTNSRRKNRPFLAVNCAALPEALLESELFGHEKGAFTDAVRRHIGRFEQCNSGTLFLDEVAEMSLKNQAKLLRVLESQEFERVGGNETIKVDVRIIAATNRSLITAVKEKRFRLDLYYRLKVVNLILPSLRERQGDIPLLVNYFMKKFAREYHKPLMQISPAAMKMLTTNPWRGNIRELKNVLNSAVLFSRGDTLVPEDFEAPLSGGKSFETGSSASSSADYSFQLRTLFDKVSLAHNGAVYEHFISASEEALVRMTMEKFKDNQVQAAKFLGISRNTLRQRLALYKVTPE